MALFVNYLRPENVIELRSPDRSGAFKELAAVLCRDNPHIKLEDVEKAILQREKSISTRIAKNIAIPHATIPGCDRPLIAVGVSNYGISYDLISEEKVHLIVLILGNDTSTHLQILSDVVKTLSRKKLYDNMVHSENPQAVYDLLVQTAGNRKSSNRSESLLSRSIFRHALAIADEIGAKFIMLFVYSSGVAEFVHEQAGKYNFILVTSELEPVNRIDFLSRSTLRFPFEGLSRSYVVELALLFAAADNLVAAGDKFVSVLGDGPANEWDTIIVNDGISEIQRFLKVDFLGKGAVLEQRVLARTLQIANMLAQEGREGKPVGTIFVLGDSLKVQYHSEQLIANPFRGLDSEERNILDPSLEETIKEFAKIDGAFVIRENGEILSAGTYIKPVNISVDLPKGFGSRHMAAASITKATGSMAIALSESTRKISLFHNGIQMVLE